MQQQVHRPRPSLAIIRTSGRPVRSEFYNVQEIGLARALVAYGWTCDVFMASPTGRYEVTEPQPFVRVFNLPYRALLGDQGIFPELLPLLRAGNYNVIQVQEHWQFTTALVAREFGQRDTPVVLGQGKYQDNGGLRRLQNYLTDWFAVPVLRRNLRGALCKTRAAEAYLHSKGISRTTVLPIGLDVEHFAGSVTNPRPPIEAGTRLIYVGYLRKPRDIPFLIRLVEQFVAQDINVCLTLVGDGPDRELCKSMLEGKPESTKRVVFTGRVAQQSLASFYANSHLFLLPTKAEIYGMAVLESMYFGVPAVSTRTAGPSDIITHGEDGFLVDGLDMAQWMDVIKSCVSDPSFHRRISQAAYNCVRNRFTWNALSPRYAEFYRSLL